MIQSKDFLYGRTSGSNPKPNGLLTAMTVNDKKPDVVYFNIYRNQLKIVLGFSEKFGRVTEDSWWYRYVIKTI